MTTWGKQGRSRLAALAVLATIAVAAPAGWAVGQELGELSGARQLSAADCADATRLFEKADLIAPSAYAGSCPSKERVLKVVGELVAAGRAVAPEQADPGEQDPGDDSGYQEGGAQ